jgi:hypothetical protein
MFKQAEKAEGGCGWDGCEDDAEDARTGVSNVSLFIIPIYSHLIPLRKLLLLHPLHFFQQQVHNQPRPTHPYDPHIQDGQITPLQIQERVESQEEVDRPLRGCSGRATRACV